jgi:hypothetical protein
MDRLTGPEAVRLNAALAQCEISLVLGDPVAAALLSQAARHARGLGPAPLVDAAARLARTIGSNGDGPAGAAGRKVVQALCRAAACEVEASLLGMARDPGGG